MSSLDAQTLTTRHTHAHTHTHTHTHDRQLNETLDALREIAEGKKTMNENFDIFELTLRRYHFQFVEMFPLATDTNNKKKREPISLIIEDPTVRAPPFLHHRVCSLIPCHPRICWQARALWDQHVGKTVYLCDFEVRAVSP